MCRIPLSVVRYNWEADAPANDVTTSLSESMLGALDSASSASPPSAEDLACTTLSEEEPAELPKGDDGRELFMMEAWVSQTASGLASSCQDEAYPCKTVDCPSQAFAKRLAVSSPKLFCWITTSLAQS